MTPEEVERDSARRLQQADEDSLLAAEAFAFGLGDQYIATKQQEILKRLAERYGGPVEPDDV